MTTNNNNNNQVATQKSAAPVRKIDILKNMLNAPSVIEQFQNALSRNTPTFVASIIDLYNGDTKLQECDPKEVVMEALKAATLKLPINKALGYSYIIPFNNSIRITDPDTGRESWGKKMVPTFQMGYKGYIQLAMRTGEYRFLNADTVYEGELRKKNKLTGEFDFDGERISDKVIGYFAYFQLTNGFSKTWYMTVEQVATHAKRYSKGLKRDTTVQGLIALANMPVSLDSKAVGWLGNFEAMGLKTVIRILLSKFGYLSVEMQQAIENDYADEDHVDASNLPGEEIKAFDISDIEYEDVTKTNTSQTNQSPEPVAIDEPPY